MSSQEARGHLLPLLQDELWLIGYPGDLGKTPQESMLLTPRLCPPQTISKLALCPSAYHFWETYQLAAEYHFLQGSPMQGQGLDTCRQHALLYLCLLQRNPYTNPRPWSRCPGPHNSSPILRLTPSKPKFCDSLSVLKAAEIQPRSCRVGCGTWEGSVMFRNRHVVFINAPWHKRAKLALSSL